MIRIPLQVTPMPRGRWAHLLGGPPEDVAEAVPEKAASNSAFPRSSTKSNNSSSSSRAFVNNSSKIKFYARYTFPPPCGSAKGGRLRHSGRIDPALFSGLRRGIFAAHLHHPRSCDRKRVPLDAGHFGPGDGPGPLQAWLIPLLETGWVAYLRPDAVLPRWPLQPDAHRDGPIHEVRSGAMTGAAR